MITVSTETAIANGRCAQCRGPLRPGARYRKEENSRDGVRSLAFHLHCVPEPVRDANGRSTPAQEAVYLRRRLAERGA